MDTIDQEHTNTLRALLRMVRRWWQRKYVSKIDHAEVVEHVRSEGRLTSRYSFMVIMSCAIAVLGLLLSSPAVVIGAMLISPLMGPIMSLGFSLCVMNSWQMKKALEGVVSGVLLALAISWLIVAVSPLTDATPEILARTRPNLFDLLVAIFSGLAGGYAVIKRKGEAIVGVAIATALMPPLAVVGFGLATDNGAIAQGAFMLFMTNLLAIALSVTLMAKFYGFGSVHGGKHTAWQFLFVACVFGVLSLPLGVALKNIAYQAYVTKTAQRTITDYFGSNKSRISMFTIQFSEEAGTSIDTVVLSSRYDAKAQENIKAALAKQIDTQIQFSLDQIVMAREVIEEVKAPAVEPAPTTALQAPPRWTRTEEMTNALKQALFFPTEYIKVDVERKLASIYAKPAKGVSIATLHQLERTLQTRYPGWNIRVVPHFGALPYVYFASGAETLDANAQDKLADIIWTLKRWGNPEVIVVGYASTVGEFEQFDNTSLAYRRAMHVLAQLEAEGIKAEPRSEYRSFRQRKDERSLGRNSFQRVEIRLVHMPENGSDIVVEEAPVAPEIVQKERVVPKAPEAD